MVSEKIGDSGTSGIDGDCLRHLFMSLDEIMGTAVSEKHKQTVKELIARVRSEARAEALKEGFDLGYAAAVKEAEDELNQPAQIKPSLPVKRPEGATVRVSTTEARLARGFTPRLTTGQVDKMVGETLRSVAPREITQTELLHKIKEQFGVTVPFTTMRRSLGRHKDAGRVKHNIDLQLWSYIGTDGPELRMVR